MSDKKYHINKMIKDGTRDIPGEWMNKIPVEVIASYFYTLRYNCHPEAQADIDCQFNFELGLLKESRDELIAAIRAKF